MTKPRLVEIRQVIEAREPPSEREWVFVESHGKPEEQTATAEGRGFLGALRRLLRL